MLERPVDRITCHRRQYERSPLPGARASERGDERQQPRVRVRIIEEQRERMALAGGGEPALRQRHGRFGRPAVAEQDPEPTAQGFQATAGADAQHAHPGQLRREVEPPQQPRFPRARRSAERELRAAPAPRPRRRFLEPPQLPLPASQRAEPDAIGRQTFAFGLQIEPRRRSERLDDLVGVRVARMGLPGEQLGDHRLHAGAPAHRRRRAKVCPHHVRRRCAGEGIPSREQLVQGDAERVQIGRGGRCASFQDLGSRVLEAPTRGALRSREPQIDEEGAPGPAAGGEHRVLRLHVGMDDAAAVQVPEGARDLGGMPHDRRFGRSGQDREVLGRVLERQGGRAAVRPQRDGAGQVRVGQGRRALVFRGEPAGGAQLQRDLFASEEIVGEVHGALAPGAPESDDPIPAADQFPGHVGSSCFAHLGATTPAVFCKTLTCPPEVVKEGECCAYAICA